MRCGLAVAALGVTAISAASPIMAEEASSPWPSIPGEWTVTLGVQGKLRPEFEGGKDYTLEPAPIFGLRRSGTAARFRAPNDSASISLLDAGGFHLGPAFNYRSSRKESDYPDALRGLGDVDWTIEAGAFAEYWLYDWFRARAEVRRGFNGHEGFVADLSVDLVKRFDQRWTLSGGPRLSLADTAATAPYFAVTPAQSIASGLPVFDAKGGFHSIGAGAQVTYQWTPQWQVRSYLEYSRLLGDAAASPLATQRGSPNQITVGTGVSYSFDVKLW